MEEVFYTFIENYIAAIKSGCLLLRQWLLDNNSLRKSDSALSPQSSKQPPSISSFRVGCQGYFTPNRAGRFQSHSVSGGLAN